MKRTPDKPSPFFAVFFVAGVIQLCLLGNIVRSLFHDPSGKQGLWLLEIHYWASHIVCGLYTC